MHKFLVNEIWYSNTGNMNYPTAYYLTVVFCKSLWLKSFILLGYANTRYFWWICFLWIYFLQIYLHVITSHAVIYFCQANSLNIGRSILYIFAHWIMLPFSAEQRCSIHMYFRAASWQFVYLSAWPIFLSPSVISHRPSVIGHHINLAKIEHSLYMNIFI